MAKLSEQLWQSECCLVRRPRLKAPHAKRFQEVETGGELFDARLTKLRRRSYEKATFVLSARNGCSARSGIASRPDWRGEGYHSFRFHSRKHEFSGRWIQHHIYERCRSHLVGRWCQFQRSCRLSRGRKNGSAGKNHAGVPPVWQPLFPLSDLGGGQQSRA